MKSGSPFLSPAKVNLILRVLRKRPDGYHDLFSVMQPISVYDEITIDVGPGEGIRVSCDKISVPSDSSNLAYRAAAVYLQRTGVKKAVDIFIRKNVPVAAGLGGGSSNAATVLLALDSLLKTGLGEKALMDMAATLGSDVPFFILRGSAVATGRGEVLERVELPGFEYVLANPGFPVSTAWVYNNLDLTKKPENNILFYSKEALTSPEKLREFLVNDLEAVTIRKYPEVLRLKEMLLECGATAALMSGSGPTVFGVFRDSVTADAAFKDVKGRLDKRVPVFRARGL
jgi:4-diphosphocytidyl-2-C-methyl-D-erythritol kinase